MRNAGSFRFVHLALSVTVLLAWIAAPHIARAQAKQSGSHGGSTSGGSHPSGGGGSPVISSSPQIKHPTFSSPKPRPPVVTPAPAPAPERPKAMPVVIPASSAGHTSAGSQPQGGVGIREPSLPSAPLTGEIQTSGESRAPQSPPAVKPPAIVIGFPREPLARSPLSRTGGGKEVFSGFEGTVWEEPAAPARAGVPHAPAAPAVAPRSPRLPGTPFLSSPSAAQPPSAVPARGFTPPLVSTAPRPPLPAAPLEKFCITPDIGCRFIQPEIIVAPAWWGWGFGWGSGFGSCWDPEMMMWVPCAGAWNLSPGYTDLSSDVEFSGDTSTAPVGVPMAPGDVSSANQDSAANPDTVIIFKDGTLYHTSEYWAENGELFFRTADGAIATAPLETIDLQTTVDANANLGQSFVLHPRDDSGQQPAETPQDNSTQP